MKPLHILSVATAMLAAGSFAISSTAHADVFHANQMEFKNEGDYLAKARVAYMVRPGRKCILDVGGTHIDQGETVTIDLTRDDFILAKEISHTSCVAGEIPMNSTVWGVFDIVFGDWKHCRKTKTIRYTETGGTVSYGVGGTMLINNRCKVSSWP